MTAARLGTVAKRCIPFRVSKQECSFVRKLDNQKPGAALYGGGFLLSDKAAAEKAAAEKAAAEKAAAEKVELSEREREIVESLGVSA